MDDELSKAATTLAKASERLERAGVSTDAARDALEVMAALRSSELSRLTVRDSGPSSKEALPPRGGAKARPAAARPATSGHEMTVEQDVAAEPAAEGLQDYD
jgi:hypothetical protein